MFAWQLPKKRIRPSELALAMVSMFPQKDEKGVRYAFTGSFALSLLLDLLGCWDKCGYIPRDIDVIARGDVNLHRLLVDGFPIDVVKRFDQKDVLIPIKIGKSVIYLANLGETIRLLKERLARNPERRNLLLHLKLSF
jgi:hypothetical protein